jgi:LuxR family maltose regulon positive regulatory protein
MPVAHRRLDPEHVAGVALLESKLSPPPAIPGAVARPALLDRLRWRHRTHPVAILAAPAGYGKTTLAAELSASDHRATAWYTLDELDDDPVTFLTYLARALERSGGLVDDLECAAVHDVPPELASAAVRSALATLPEPLILVLDNVHLLHDPSCLSCLEALAVGTSPGSQLLLATRRRPALGAGDDRIVQLGVEDLQLTPHETQLLLRNAGVDVGENAAAALAAGFEGWAAGLYLVAKSGRSSVESPIADERTVDRFVDDYLHSEVLDALDPDTYTFLRGVSPLERVSGSVADSILGRHGSAGLLRELADANLFVTALDDSSEWYALHPCLRNLLWSELRRAESASSEQILDGAVDWFEAHGAAEAAVDCAVVSANRERAGALVAAASPSVYWSGRENVVERWLAQVDEPAVLLANPALAVIGSGLLALLGYREPAGRWAALAAGGVSASPMPDGSPDTAWVLALRAFLCPGGSPQMLADAQAACETLADGSPLLVGALLSRGFAELLDADSASAESSFADADRRAAKLGIPVGSSVALAMLSLLAAGSGDRAAAAERARCAAAAVGRGRLERHVSTAVVHAAAARAAIVQGQVSNAQRSLQMADDLVDRVTYAVPWFAAYVKLELAHAHLTVGNGSRARALLAGAEEVVSRRPGLGFVDDWIGALRQDVRLGRSVADGATTALTAAELRLLPLLPSYLSFRQIADSLGISRNTVKTQAISVYRKLGVRSRTEAVQRAQALGLLD